MFEFGRPEEFLIMVIAVLILGPQEIPVVMRSLGRLVRRLKYLNFAIMQQVDEMIDIHEQKTGDQGKDTSSEKDEDAWLEEELQNSEETDEKKKGSA